MSDTDGNETQGYRDAMGRLLVLYTQVDRLVLEACAERIGSAPDEPAKLALAKQVGDESRHVQIQRQWMQRFGADSTPVIPPEQEERIRDHFRNLSWLDFLADMYLCVEALGSEAVEKIVPLTDPGTRESLRVPLSDEVDHVAFGVQRLRQELEQLSADERAAFLAGIPARMDALTRSLHGMGLDLPAMFEAVGADYRGLCKAVLRRREEILGSVEIAAAA